MDEDAYIRSSKANYERLLESIKQVESINVKRKKVLVSACLLGIDCKYNGKNNKNDKVIELLKDHDLIPVCPEIMGGLTTPRTPAEINKNEVITKDAKNVTKQYQKGAEETLKIAKLYNCNPKRKKPILRLWKDLRWNIYRDINRWGRNHSQTAKRTRDQDHRGNNSEYHRIR